jgi:hypothetical protein
MRTSVKWLAIALAGLVCSSAPNAKADGDNTETKVVHFSGSWQGGAFSNNDTNKFAYCIAFANYRSGINMFVAVDRDFGWGLMFQNMAWNMNPGSKIPLIARFDGSGPWTGDAVVVNSHLARIPMAPNSTLIRLFRGARQMTVDAAGQTFFFNLDGTSRLLVELAQCVTTALAVERGEPPPSFAAAPPPQPKPINPTAPAPVASTAPGIARNVQLETEMAATRIASNLLLQAKFPNARLLSEDQAPAGLKGRGAVWASDIGIGAVELLPSTVAKDAQKVASSMVADDSSTCKGDFVSGRSSDLVDNRIVVKASSLCRDSTGDHSYHYFILQSEVGEFIVYVLAGTSDADNAPSNGKLSDADFQTVAVKAAFSK